MTGLDKIISTINENSASQCETIVSSAREQAEKIVEEAEKKASADTAAFESETENQVKKLLTGAESSASLASKQAVLSAKVDIINEMLKSALDEIKAEPVDKYFGTLITLAVKYAEKGKGVMKLSASDKERMPKDFAEKVNNALSGSGRSVEIGGNADIDSGFILVYGDIEINCSFDAVIAENRDELRDEINDILFD